MDRTAEAYPKLNKLPLGRAPALVPGRRHLAPSHARSPAAAAADDADDRTTDPPAFLLGT